jgi:RNA polymerase sigma-70 factor (ECF subfamily)
MTDWTQVVKQHGPIVWRTAYRLLNHEADAGDCFQNTFVCALELSRGGKVRNWPGLLKRLATARALDRLRQRYREAARLTRLPDDFRRPGKAAEPSRRAEEAELAEHLRDALAEIDAQQAEVFCLACLEGLDYREIAKHMGITVNHVGVLLHRAKSSLRERLQAHGPAPAGEPSPRETKP